MSRSSLRAFVIVIGVSIGFQCARWCQAPTLYLDNVTGILYIVGAEVLFCCAVLSVCCGMSALQLPSPAQPMLRTLCYVVTSCAIVLEIVAHSYFSVTGVVIERDMMIYVMTHIADSMNILWYALPEAMTIAEITIVIIVVCLVSPFFTRLGRRARAPFYSHSAYGRRYIIIIGSMVLGAGAYGIAGRLMKASAVPIFMRSSIINMALFWPVAIERVGNPGDDRSREAGPLRFVRGDDTNLFNVAIVILESSRAQSFTVYDPSIATTPYLAEMASESVVAVRAYSVIPHTSKALVAILCGVVPALGLDIVEADVEIDDLRSIAHLLAAHGYKTAFFQAATEHFESRRSLITNMGFERFTPVEEMDRRGFAKVNYLGYEDDVMLAPMRQWIRQHRNVPQLAVYLTITPHHSYRAGMKHDSVAYSQHRKLNGYLNAIAYTDRFVQQMVTLYKEEDVYRDTVFVIVGDHGEAFGEHARWYHNDVLYDEGVRVPMMYHKDGLWNERCEITSPVSHLDIVPTLADILGFQIRGSVHAGASIFADVGDRVVRMHGWGRRSAMARVANDWKYIHFFNGKPDEMYNLMQDPLERNNVCDKFPRRSVEALQDLYKWRNKVEMRWR